MSQGEGFRAYCSAVPRLLPALRPKLPAGSNVPSWTGGLLGEAFMWAIAAAVVTFAITLNLNAYFIVMSSAFVVYAICVAIIKRKSRSVTGR